MLLILLSAASHPVSAQSLAGKPMIQSEDWIPRTLVIQSCFQRIMHCLLECLSSLGRCTGVKRKLQKFLGLELGKNTESHRITLFYLVVKTLTFWSRLSTAFGCKQVCNVKMLGHGKDAESCIHHTCLFSLSWALNKASVREFLFQGVWKDLRKQWGFYCQCVRETVLKLLFCSVNVLLFSGLK